MNLALRNRDQRTAWMGSILFHCILGIVLLFWYIETPIRVPDTVEVTFLEPIVPPPAPPTAAPASTAPKARPTPAKRKPAEPTRRVNLPERTSTSRDEVIPLPQARKLDAPEASGTARRSGTSGGRKEAASRGATSAARSDQTGGKGGGARSGSGRTQGSVSQGTGASTLGTIQWIGGGKRRKLSGSLPRYPAGTSVEAQIKIEAVVTPAGTVKSVRPAQKGNAKLEEAAMRSLRQWRFEPLARNLPQKDQRCVVTFNFELR